MLKDSPKLSYCGLTVVMSNPSRFDKTSLITANAGWLFSEMCLRPDFNRHQCEIRLKEDRSPLLPNTKCVLLLGSTAARDWLNNTENTLNEIRGSVYSIKGIPHIASYFPQDCVDIKDFEAELNPLDDKFVDAEYSEFDEDDADTSATDDKRRHGKTKRKNYGFWLMKDVAKCKHILLHGLPERIEPTYKLMPRRDEVIDLLQNQSQGKEFLYFDSETDCELNIQCFSFSYDYNNIYVVPCLLPDYSNAYSGLSGIFKALSIGIRNCCFVAHNGAGFDFRVLINKYRIPIYRVYDTMVAQHRCFPEQEKSLGHLTSLWTYEPFHKDEGDIPYNDLTNAKKLWQYCGKDTFTMALAHKAIQDYAAKIPGLPESIRQGNESILPYLICSLQGMRYNKSEVDKIINENDREMTQHLRWLDILVGKENLKLIRGKGKSSMPGSNPQCVRYFHDMLGYPVAGKGKERKDGTKGPSLGKKNLFKLRLREENPVIDICLAYRETGKETGALQFTPWKIET